MTPLQRKKKYRQMLREGETPESFQNKFENFASQQEQLVVSQLKQSEEKVEQIIHEFINQMKNMEEFQGADDSLQNVKQTTDSIQKEVVEILTKQLDEKQRLLQQQLRQKEIVLQAIYTYRKALKKPSEAEEFITDAGQRICHKIRDSQ